MSYEALLRKSWKSGDFVVSEAEAVQADPADESRRKVRREMEEIAARGLGRQLLPRRHREGIMKLLHS